MEVVLENGTVQHPERGFGWECWARTRTRREIRICKGDLDGPSPGGEVKGVCCPGLPGRGI